MTTFTDLARIHAYALRPSERRVVDHLSGCELTAATAASVAAAVGVAQGTVVNALQRLGYGGFADFRRRVLAERAVEEALSAVAAADGTHNGASGARGGPHNRAAVDLWAAKPVAVLDSIQLLRRRVFDEDRAILEATDRLLDDDAFRCATETLAAARAVYCIGAEQSGLMARLAAGTFIQKGIPATAEDHPSQQLAHVEVADPSLALLAISYNGRNRALAAVATRARERGMPVVALTNNAGQRLGRAASIVLQTAGPIVADGVDPNLSGGRPAQLTIIRALAEAVAYIRERP